MYPRLLSLVCQLLSWVRDEMDASLVVNSLSGGGSHLGRPAVAKDTKAAALPGEAIAICAKRWCMVCAQSSLAGRLDADLIRAQGRTQPSVFFDAE